MRRRITMQQTFSTRFLRSSVWLVAFAVGTSVILGDETLPLTDSEREVEPICLELIEELEQRPFDRDDLRWIEAMMELADVGPDAIPHMSDALESTESDRLKRRLLIVLRTMNDVRAVPTMIRFFPRLPEKTGSDMGMLISNGTDVSDEMQAWLLQHCKGYRSDGGLRYSYGRPINEAYRGLESLTGKQFGGNEIRFVSYTGDASRDNAIARLFQKHAKRWAEWWNENASELTDDERYHRVELPPLVQFEGPSAFTPGAKAEVVSSRSNVVLSPIDFDGNHGRCFLDLDTGRSIDGRNRWQGEPVDQMVAWAVGEGFDLMVVERDDGEPTRYALKPLAASFWQIARSDANSIEKFLDKTSQIMLGETGELLLDYVPETKEYGDDAKPAFLYETSDGSVGAILVDSDVTELFKVDRNGRVINGGPVDSTPEERGFSYGVKLSVRDIGVPRDGQ